MPGKKSQVSGDIVVTNESDISRNKSISIAEEVEGQRKLSDKVKVSSHNIEKNMTVYRVRYSEHNNVFQISSDNVIQFDNLSEKSYMSDPDDQMIGPLANYEENCTGNYANKVLVLHKDMIEIVKEPLDSDVTKRTLFVLNKSVIEGIRNNEYHLDDLLCDIAKAIGVEPERIKLTFVTDLKYLKEGYTKVKLTKMLDPYGSDTAIEKIAPVKPLKHINVKVENFKNEEVTVNVAIQDLTYGSQWLGGYRDKKTGITYHHAIAQTEPRDRNYGRPLWDLPPPLFTRDTQTHEFYKEASVNLPIDHSTQMSRPDYYIPADTDIILNPRTYIPYKDLISGLREKSAIVIQKYWRGNKVRKLILPKVYEAEANYQKFKEKLLYDDIGIEVNPQIVSIKTLNMVYPYKRNEFYTLQWLLYNYKKNLKKGIENLSSGITKKAYNSLYFEKEVELMQVILSQIISAKNDSVVKFEKQLLEEQAASQMKVNLDKDIMFLIEDKNTEKCREFKELYALYRRTDINVPQRQEILLIFKDFMDSYGDFEMKEDLIDLLEREAILLSSGVPMEVLNLLQKRAEEIIIHFIRSQECFSGAKQKRTTTLKHIIRCKTCLKYQYVTEFPISTKAIKPTTCKSCLNKYYSAFPLKNPGNYTKLLYQIRKDEYKLGCPNPFSCLLQPYDLQCIVQDIWGARSIISNIAIFSELRLPRWDNRLPWAPWNCILLTKEEAQEHQCIGDVNSFYATEFCNIIKSKHVKALCDFKKLFILEKEFRNNSLHMPDNEFMIDAKYILNIFADIKSSFFVSPPTKK